MALETVPESTIIESTTMSGAIGSRPGGGTLIPVRVLRSSTALMLEEPTSSPTIVFDPIPNMCPPLSTEFAYGVPAAFIAALIFFLPRGSVSIDFTSIHSSSFDFLKRQRLPNLNAGIFCSFTYLYSVSGLTPRYCEAWRIFITSRESAITFFSPAESRFPAQPFLPVNAGVLRRTDPSIQTRSSVFWCAEHSSTGTEGLSTGISRFLWVLWGFSGFHKKWTCSASLQVVV